MRWILLIIVVFFGIHLRAQNIQLTRPVKFLALGDSYTIGQSVKESERWPVQLKNTLQNKGVDFSEIKIIAQTGWRTDDLINAIKIQKPDSDYNLVSLLIGVNNQFQRSDFETYILEFEQLLNTAIKLAGNVKKSVFVVSIPDYGYTPFGIDYQEFISTEIDKYNQANKTITENYGIAYIDITPISREGIEKADYVAGDGLHPSGEMYAEWVDLILDATDLFGSTNNRITENNDHFEVYVSIAEKKIIVNSIQSINKKSVYQVFDFSGRIHLSGELLENEIDIAGLSRGIYIINLIGNSGLVFRKKFLIHE